MPEKIAKFQKYRAVAEEKMRREKMQEKRNRQMPKLILLTWAFDDKRPIL